MPPENALLPAKCEKCLPSQNNAGPQDMQTPAIDMYSQISIGPSCHFRLGPRDHDHHVPPAPGLFADWHLQE